MTSIVYEISGLSRPKNGVVARLLLKINAVPVIRNFPLFKNLFYRTFSLPKSTSLNKGFYCSAPNISVGDNVGLADTFILAYAPVKIGNRCSFSFRNMIITSTHDFAEFSTVIAKPVVIEDNVWITTNVTILPGVTIGENSVIGAGSVVSKSIPPNVFAAGNPCKVIRNIIRN